MDFFVPACKSRILEVTFVADNDCKDSPMHRISNFDDWGLLYVTYTAPFTGSELLEVAKASTTIGGPTWLHKCSMIDLRSVSLHDLSGADSRRFASLRKAKLSGAKAEPTAFVLSSEQDFAMVRMHNQWVEAYGVRHEIDTFATLNLASAFAWLEEATSQPGLHAAMLDEITCRNRGAAV